MTGTRLAATETDTANASWQSLAFRTGDGLRLHARCYRARGSTRRPALCLAGLTRNARDFHVLASALSTGPEARDVYAVDMRGRGGSDHDSDHRNYTILVEMSDVQDFMTTFGLHDVALIGTSRGGLIAMGLAALQPTRIGAVVLNDIGPVIDKDGLARIAAYVGKTPTPASWEEAGAMCEKACRASFQGISDVEWIAVARQWFNEVDGRPAPGYDPDIAKVFNAAKSGIPELWPQFDALRRVPCLTLRGALSDLLTDETLSRMAARHPDFEAYTVPRQGHAPLLRDEESIAVISRFLARSDGRVSVHA